MRSPEQLRDALIEWGQLYNRRLGEPEIDVWMRLFSNTHPRLLQLALEKVTKESERMPTPGHLTKALALAREQVHFGDTRITHTEGWDRNKVPCWYWSDAPTVPAYRPQDCEEGCEVLKRLASLADRMELPS